MTDPDEHAAKFQQLAYNVIKLAQTMCQQHPDFPQQDFGRVFLIAGMGLIDGACGTPALIAYLRDLANDFEALGKLPQDLPPLPPGHA